MDGGGLRLYYTNQILKSIEDKIQYYILDHEDTLSKNEYYTSKDEFIVYLADYFDCIAGVSGAAWTATYLASKGGNGNSDQVLRSRSIIRKYGRIQGGTAAGLDVFFLEYGTKIYPPGISKYVRGLSFNFNLRKLLTVPGFNSPLYPVRGLQKALDDFLGDVKYSDMHTSCLINAYDLNTNGPLMFAADRVSAKKGVGVTYLRSKNDPRREFGRVNASSYTGSKEHWTSRDFFVGDLVIRHGMEFLAKDTALASSALPMFHPAHKARPLNRSYEEHFVFIDGGLVEGNPTLYSLNFVTSRVPAVPIDDIAIMSLGSGSVACKHLSDASSGVFGWALSGALMEITIGGGSEARQAETDYLLYTTLGMKPGQYLRINHFAEGPVSSKDVLAFSRFDAAHYWDVYERVGVKTAQKYAKHIMEFVEDYIFSKRQEKSK